MKDHDKLISTENKGNVSIEVSGKNVDTWKEKSPSFFIRLKNSLLKFLGADIKPAYTADNAIINLAENAVESAQALVKNPQLINQERQASIKLKLAEAEEKLANANKTNIESELLSIELERAKIINSQKYIDRLIQRGELVPVEKNGQIYLVYNKKE